MEDSVTKATTFYSNYPEGHKDGDVLTLAKVQVPDAKFGDIIQCGRYRYGDAYVVGKDGLLIRNPDTSNSGYMSIPYEVTQYLTDAVGKYEDEEVFDIALRHDDVFLSNWFGTLPDVFQEFKFVWVVSNGSLRIKFPSGISNDFYPPKVKRILNVDTHTLEDVLAFYEGTKGPQCRVTLNYHIDAENFPRFAEKYSNKAEIDKQIAELEAEDAKTPPDSVPFGGGVLPNIHSVLIPQRPKAAPVSETATAPAAHTNIGAVPATATVFAFPTASPADAPPAPSFAGFGFGAASYTPPPAPAAAAAVVPGAEVSAAPVPSFAGFGFGAASYTPPPAPAATAATAATAAVVPGAEVSAPPAPSFAGFGFGAASYTPPPAPAAAAAVVPGAEVSAAPVPSFAGFGFGAASYTPPPAPAATAATAAVVPGAEGSAVPVPSFAGFGFGAASHTPPPAPAAAAAAAVVPGAEGSAVPAPSFAGFGFGAASSGPGLSGGSLAFMMKKIQLQANVRFQEPKAPPSFSRYNRRCGLQTGSRSATIVYQGPKADLEALKASLSEYFDSFEYKVDVVDI